jgi:hypothetical protein
VYKNVYLSYLRDLLGGAGQLVSAALITDDNDGLMIDAIGGRVQIPV